VRPDLFRQWLLPILAHLTGRLTGGLRILHALYYPYHPRGSQSPPKRVLLRGQASSPVKSTMRSPRFCTMTARNPRHEVR
jgi:hypothetical protein